MLLNEKRQSRMEAYLVLGKYFGAGKSQEEGEGEDDGEQLHGVGFGSRMRICEALVCEDRRVAGQILACQRPGAIVRHPSSASTELNFSLVRGTDPKFLEKRVVSCLKPATELNFSLVRGTDPKFLEKRVGS